MLPFSAPSLNLNSLLAETVLEDVQIPHTVGAVERHGTTDKDKGRLAAKPKTKPTRKKVPEVEAVEIEDEIMVVHEMEADAQKGDDEEMEELKDTPQNMEEADQEMDMAPSPAALEIPPSVNATTLEEAIGEEEEEVIPEPSTKKLSVIPPTTSIPPQPIVQQATSPTADLSEIRESDEEEEEESEIPITQSFHTANLEPEDPFSTLSAAPEPIAAEDLEMNLKDWHRKLIDQAIKETERKMQQQLDEYDEKVRLGRERLLGVLGL